MCRHEQTKEIKGAPDQNLKQCKKCGVIFNPDIVNKKNVLETYENYYEKGYPSRFNRYAEMVVSYFRYRRAVRIKKYKKDVKSILDVGCGRGLMLNILSKIFHVKNVEGTQIEHNSYEYATKELGLKVYNADLPTLEMEPKRFDFITYWHVLEHLQHPEAHLEEVHKLLTEGGVLLIEVPNYNAWTRWISRGRWLSFDPQNHIYFFTKKSLVNFVEGFGFKLTHYTSFSTEYSIFTSVQSLANFFTRTDNLVYKWLQKKVKFTPTIALHVILFGILTPVCFVINLFLYWIPLGEVNHCVFTKASKYS